MNYKNDFNKYKNSLNKLFPFLTEDHKLLLMIYLKDSSSIKTDLFNLSKKLKNQKSFNEYFEKEKLVGDAKKLFDKSKSTHSLNEGISTEKRFVLHKHNPRNGSEHYDLRYEDLRNEKLLHSFALPQKFLEDVTKSTSIKTRDHDIRWLDLKSYRLEVIDRGTLIIKVMTSKYHKLEFKGKLIKGTYILFKKSNTKRDDVWILKKEK